jgi:protein TonB
VTVAMLPDAPVSMTPPPPKRRRPYRVPMGMPGARQDWRSGSAFSIGFHLVALLLIISPFAVVSNVFELPQGAGGPGPAGGGGGGTRGSGQIRAEAIRFIQAAPPPPPKAVPAKVEVPVLPKPEIIPAPQPVLEAPKPVEVTTVPPGVGGGTGADGTAGSGPGTGGGVGTGVGTGRGSAVGPGTGGGGEANYPPTPIEMFLPPLPVPDRLKGHRLVVEFDVDEKGRVLSVNFNETSDRGYNRRLRDVFKGYRFRPGHRPDGTPIRMKGQIVAEL